jgi:hypothetical protein
MISVKTNIEPREVALTATRSTLFVEGGGEKSFDVSAMKTLFDGEISVEPLGPADGVRFAAEAFKQSHPEYFFLIDRDTLDDKTVKKYWKDFDLPKGNNLLILKKREIENYFLSPAFLCISQFRNTKISEKNITNKIICFAKKRLYADALNFVIISCREELQRTEIRIESVNNIETEQDALKTIEKIKSFHTYNNKVKNLSKKMTTMFSDRLKLLCGDSKSLQFEKGQWQDQMEGKEILHNILSQGFFRVETNDKKILEGTEKFNAIIKDLLKPENQNHPAFPDELQTIKSKIRQKLGFRDEITTE